MKLKLNGGNLVQGANTWAWSLLRYSAVFISRRKCELQAIDRKTRRLFTIYEGLHPKYYDDRLRIYCTWKRWRIGLIAIEDCVELAVRGLGVRKVPGSEERLI